MQPDFELPENADSPSIEPRSLKSSAPIPDDLRTPWGWADLFTFSLFALGGTFLISAAMVFVFLAFGIGPRQIRTSPTTRSYFAILNQVVVSFALLAYLAAQAKARVEGSFWHVIGWRPLVTNRLPKAIAYGALIAGGLSLSMFVQFASQLYQSKGQLPIEAFFQDRGSALLLMIVSVLIAPVLEETIFRGLIYPVIARSFGIAASVLFTGTLFGLLHAAQLWGGWTQIGLLVLVGIVFTQARAATRTVFASYLLHLSYNSFLFLSFLASSHWLRNMPGDS